MKILAIGDFHGKFPIKLKSRIKKENIDLILALGDYTGLDDWRPIIKEQFKSRKQSGNVKNPEEILGKKKYQQLLKKDYKAGKDILKEINSFGIKTFSIFGNGDWYEELYKKEFNNPYGAYENYIKKLKNITNLNKGKQKFKGITLVGFGGYQDVDTFIKNKNFIKNKKRFKKIKKRYMKSGKQFSKLISNKPDILLLHYPPVGYFDKIKAKIHGMHNKSAGVGYYNIGIKKYKPALVLMGHMHEYQGKKNIERSLIVATGAAHDNKAVVIDFDNIKKKVKSVKFLK